MTLYEVLGVQPDATHSEIFEATIKLARDHDPSLVPEHLIDARAAAEKRLKAIIEASMVLGDEGKRAKYDAQLERRRHRRVIKLRVTEDVPKRAREDITARNAADRFRQRRLAELERKKRLLIAAGVAVFLAAISPLLVAAGQWTLRGWWRASGAIGNTEDWRVEKLRFYPVMDSEKEAVPGAAVTLRGYVKGLPGCYIIPARGSVVAEDNNRVTIRVEMHRLGAWNKAGSFMGTCTENFAPIEAPLVGDIKTWDAIDLIAVDADAKLERVFSEAKVQWDLKR